MRRVLVVLLVLTAVAGVLLAPSYVRYRRLRGAVPPGVRLAGMEFSSENAAAVAEALGRVLGEPATLYYGDQRILLRPQVVGFQVDAAAMLAQARQYENPGHLVRLWVGEALDRRPAPVDIPLRYKLDRDALDNFLADIGRRYDRPPQPPQPDLANWGFLPGRGGRQLDLNVSRERAIAALTSPTVRTADLVMRETAAPPIQMELLKTLLAERLAAFGGVTGLFLHHTATGAEVAINAGVAFSGMSTMKIAILAELYRKLDAPPDPQTTQWITEMVALAGNRSANELLGVIGGGDADTGAQTLNQSLRRLGLTDTFMAAPYDQEGTGPRVRTAANSQGQPDTRADPYVQTTPRDIGLMLEMIVECSQGGGTLLAAYAREITQPECAQLLDFLKLNDVTDLIPAGLPEGTRVVHKHGYVSHTHGDVAAIWGPAGPYVLAIFLHRPPWLEWDLSSETMAELSAIVWRYFALVGP